METIDKMTIEHLPQKGEELQFNLACAVYVVNSFVISHKI